MKLSKKLLSFLTCAIILTGTVSIGENGLADAYEAMLKQNICRRW